MAKGVKAESGGSVEEPSKELGSVQRTARTCPVCGNELASAMEFCAVCMLRQDLGSGVASTGSLASEEKVEIAPKQTRKRFEHYKSGDWPSDWPGWGADRARSWSHGCHLQGVRRRSAMPCDPEGH